MLFVYFICFRLHLPYCNDCAVCGFLPFWRLRATICRGWRFFPWCVVGVAGWCEGCEYSQHSFADSCPSVSPKCSICVLTSVCWCVAFCLLVRFRLPIGLFSIACQCFSDCHIRILHRRRNSRNCQRFWLKSLSPISVEIENGVVVFMGVLGVKWLPRVSLGSCGDGSSESSRCERCLIELRKMVFRSSISHVSSLEKASFATRLGIFRNVGGRRW